MKLHTLILTLLLIAPAAAQPWLKAKLLVVPGKSLGPIGLGQPVSQAYPLMGRAVGSDEVSKNTSKDGASVEWRAANDVYIRVKCHDGRQPENVFQIFWTAPNPRTAGGLGVGSSVAAVQKAFPKGRWTTDTLDGAPTWLTPGLNWTFNEKRSKVVEMHLCKP